MEPNLRVFAYHSQPVLVLREADSDFTLLRPDGSVTLGMSPFSQLPAGSYQEVAELLKQGLFLPQEVQGYQLQSARLLEEVAASFEGEATESVLRVRLLPLLLMLDSVKRTLLPEYERAVAQVLSAYYKELRAGQDRLLMCWEDLAAALNHVLGQQSEKSMQRVLKQALTKGLLQHLLAVVQWMEVKELVKIQFELLKGEVGKSEQVCGRLMERFSDCEGVFDLLRMAHTFASGPQEQAVVSASLRLLQGKLQEKLTKPQQQLLNSLLWQSADLLLQMDLPLRVLLADLVTKEATQHFVVRQIAAGVCTFEAQKSQLGVHVLVECFTKIGLKEVILAKQWTALASLKASHPVDALLEAHLSLLLETQAPRALLGFVGLATSVKHIKAAKVPVVWKGAAVDVCLGAKDWNDRDKKAVAADVKAIGKLTCTFLVLFVKTRTKFVRLPSLLAKEVIFEYLVK